MAVAADRQGHGDRDVRGHARDARFGGRPSNALHALPPPGGGAGVVLGRVQGGARSPARAC
eukprot:1132578-Pleurochrysis_carterae.AAC.1